MNESPHIQSIKKKSEGIEIVKVQSQSDMDDVLYLRDKVYVQEKTRLENVNSMTETFDRFNKSSVYFVAKIDGNPIGCVKVIVDSRLGLPCEKYVSIEHLREIGPVVEVGHLLTLGEHRSLGIGSQLMREAFIYSVRNYHVRYFIGDYFVEKTSKNGLHGFYNLLGFKPLTEPYQDKRFKHAPLSIIAVLDVEDSYNLYKNSKGKQKELLGLFYQNYSALSGKVVTDEN